MLNLHGVLSLTWHLCPAALSESIWMAACQVTVPLTAGEMTPSWFTGEKSAVLTRVVCSHSQVPRTCSQLNVTRLPLVASSLPDSPLLVHRSNIFIFLPLFFIQEYLYRVVASHEGGSVYSDWSRGRSTGAGKWS